MYSEEIYYQFTLFEDDLASFDETTKAELVSKIANAIDATMKDYGFGETHAFA